MDKNEKFNLLQEISHEVGIFISNKIPKTDGKVDIHDFFNVYSLAIAKLLFISKFQLSKEESWEDFLQISLEDIPLSIKHYLKSFNLENHENT